MDGYDVARTQGSAPGLEVSQEDIDPPDHDEYELAEKLATAMQDRELVTVRYWKHTRCQEIYGVVKKIDPLKRAILVDGSTEEDWDQRWTPAEHIFEVEC